MQSKGYLLSLFRPALAVPVLVVLLAVVGYQNLVTVPKMYERISGASPALNSQIAELEAGDRRDVHPFLKTRGLAHNSSENRQPRRDRRGAFGGFSIGCRRFSRPNGSGPNSSSFSNHLALSASTCSPGIVFTRPDRISSTRRLISSSHAASTPSSAGSFGSMSRVV